MSQCRNTNKRRAERQYLGPKPMPGGTAMPIVQIEILEGRTLDQKRAMVKEVTDAICNTLNAKKESVHIIIREMKPEEYAESGQLRVDKK